jgi:hypothetical protein
LTLISEALASVDLGGVLAITIPVSAGIWISEWAGWLRKNPDAILILALILGCECLASLNVCLISTEGGLMSASVWCFTWSLIEWWFIPLAVSFLRTGLVAG